MKKDTILIFFLYLIKINQAKGILCIIMLTKKLNYDIIIKCIYILLFYNYCSKRWNQCIMQKERSTNIKIGRMTKTE